MAKPFLKWVGGKQKLADTIVALIESSGFAIDAPGAHYREPFLGGGSVFFALRERHRRSFQATLSDANLEVANAFREVRDRPEEVAAIANAWPINRHHYAELGRTFRGLNPPHQTWSAARTIYLNKCGFNGLYRIGPNGWNVPWGKPPPTLKVADPLELESCAHALTNVEVDAGDYAELAGRARPGDLVYFDPPYVGVYSGYLGGFDWGEHEKLRDLFFALAARGVYVVLSNSDTPWVRDAFVDARVHPITARRSVSARGDSRGTASEIVAIAGPGIAAGVVTTVPELRQVEEGRVAKRRPEDVRALLELNSIVKVTWVDGLDQWAIHPGSHSPVSDTLFVNDDLLDSPVMVDRICKKVLGTKL